MEDDDVRESSLGVSVSKKRLQRFDTARRRTYPYDPEQIGPLRRLCAASWFAHLRTCSERYPAMGQLLSVWLMSCDPCADVAPCNLSAGDPRCYLHPAGYAFVARRLL
jgi:hypothetical protein